MPHDLPKAYDPGAIESRWAEYWVEQQLFTVENSTHDASSQQAFTLLLRKPYRYLIKPGAVGFP